MAIGQCGSVLGSHLFPAIDGPRYIKGFAVSCALEFVAALCAIVLTVSGQSRLQELHSHYDFRFHIGSRTGDAIASTGESRTLKPRLKLGSLQIR